MTGDPSKVDEAAKLLEEIHDRLDQADGFRGVVALAQRDTGKSLVATFWDSEAAMSASEEMANQARSTAAERLGATGAPEIERYEVIFYRAK
jgi:heme-degrading monooxygenase HmoA